MADTMGSTETEAPGGDAQNAVVSALQSQNGNSGGGQAPAQGQQTPQAQPPAQPAQDGSGLVSPFLERVDPADRAIVEKYVKDWDGGVTRKFQELHGQLEPYQQLGADPQTLEQAVQLMQMIDSEPEKVLGLLQQAIGDGKGDPQGQEEPQQGDDWQSQLPPQFMDKFNQFEQVLEMMAGNFVEQRESAKFAEEDAALESVMTELKTKHGDFDEDYVLTKIASGMEPEAAVQGYQKAIQSQVNTRAATPNVPKILGGGGAAPQQVTDITKASSKDVKNLVANILAQAAQART